MHILKSRKAESNRQVYRVLAWQKTQVSQDNSFSDILITGNAPVS